MKNLFHFLSPTGEGGEFESFVLDCPLFNHPLSVENVEVIGEKNSWRGNFVLK
jgi:diphthamide synthase (EF-2-diphthine--ammonia ligase)